MKAKGLMCHELGAIENLSLADYDIPVPHEGEILIQVAMAAVNFPDLLIVQGLYQARPELPFVVGSEMAGIVQEVGEQVPGIQVGDRIAGYARTGAFGTHAIIRAQDALLLPADVTMQQAAAFTVTYGTSYHALVDRAQLQAGERVVVLGAAGGVGLAAVEIAAMLGAEVIACASTSEKLELTKKYGATHTINYTEEDLAPQLKEILGRRGADIIYDPVGGDYSEIAFRRLAYGGRHLVIGFTAGKIPNLPMNLPLLKSAALMGAFWGAFCSQFPEQAKQNHEQILSWIADQKLNPMVSKVFPLSEGVAALNWVGDRKALGKILIKMPS